MALEYFGEEDRPASLHDIPELQAVQVRDGIMLRPLEASDAPAILGILDADPGIRNRVTVASKMHSPEDVAREVEAYQADANTMRYAISEDDMPIGLVSFWRDIGKPFDIPDDPNGYGFGYFLDPGKRGRGIVGGSLAKLMEAASKTLYVRQFVAFCEDDNKESISVLTKLGFGPTDVVLAEQDSGWVERQYVKPVQRNRFAA